MRLILYYDYFFFFQAEDGIRDRDVTGVQTCALPIYLGRRGSLLSDRPSVGWRAAAGGAGAGGRLVRNEHPILLEDEMAALRRGGVTGRAHAVTIAAVWSPACGPDGLRSALETLRQAARDAVEQGARILVLSDREADAMRSPIP